MKLSFSMLCKYADISHDGAFMHIMEAGVGGILVPKLPIRIPLLYYAARLIFKRDEFHEIENGFTTNVIVKKPDGSLLTESGINHSASPAKKIADYEDEAATAIVIALAGLPISEEGKYIIEFLFNGQVVDSQQLGVKIIPGTPGII